MQYSKATFKFTKIEPYQQDLLIDELAGIGFDTFEESECGFTAYIAAQSFDAALLADTLQSFEYPMEYEYALTEIEEQNWNKEWEMNFQPLTISDECYVRATFHAAQPQYTYEIVIDPKMSFGTGHHQTTSMMMQYILSADLENQLVLDMGCGTGILAILASKRGAAKVIAIDYDEICYQSVLENSLLNNIGNITAYYGGKEVIPALSYDCILANINRNILLDQIADYASVLKSGGSIYFSGFYEVPDLDMIKEECLKFGIHYNDHKKTNEWVAARFHKE